MSETPDWCVRLLTRVPPSIDGRNRQVLVYSGFVTKKRPNLDSLTPIYPRTQGSGLSPPSPVRVLPSQASFPV